MSSTTDGKPNNKSSLGSFASRILSPLRSTKVYGDLLNQDTHHCIAFPSFNTFSHTYHRRCDLLHPKQEEATAQQTPKKAVDWKIKSHMIFEAGTERTKFKTSRSSLPMSCFVNLPTAISPKSLGLTTCTTTESSSTSSNTYSNEGSTTKEELLEVLQTGSVRPSLLTEEAQRVKAKKFTSEREEHFKFLKENFSFIVSRSTTGERECLFSPHLQTPNNTTSSSLDHPSPNHRHRNVLTNANTINNSTTTPTCSQPSLMNISPIILGDSENSPVASITTDNNNNNLGIPRRATTTSPSTPPTVHLNTTTAPTSPTDSHTRPKVRLATRSSLEDTEIEIPEDIFNTVQLNDSNINDTDATVHLMVTSPIHVNLHHRTTSSSRKSYSVQSTHDVLHSDGVESNEWRLSLGAGSEEERRGVGDKGETWQGKLKVA